MSAAAGASGLVQMPDLTGLDRLPVGGRELQEDFGEPVGPSLVGTSIAPTCPNAVAASGRHSA